MQISTTEKNYVSPEDLFFALSLMNGKSLDYAYISEMKDIEQNRKIQERGSINNLVECGFLVEDFLGDTEVTDKAKSYIYPIINSEFSACISVAEADQTTVYRVHSDYKNTVVVKKGDGRYSLELLELDNFNGIFDKLLVDNEDATETVDFGEIEYVVDINCYDTTKGRLELRYGIANNNIYALNSQSKLVAIKSDDMRGVLSDLFGGV